MLSWAELRREPFRILFPLGTAFGLVGVGHWLVYALGLTRSYSGFYHASVQIGGFASCFILGFLLTVLPRFASLEPTSNAELFVILALLVTQMICLSLGWWSAAQISFIGLLIVLAVFAASRLIGKESKAHPPTEFVWIPIAILHGIAGATLLLFGQLRATPWALALGRPMMQQGFLLSMVMGVGGFMAPRLMGRGFIPVAPASAMSGYAPRIRRRKMILHVTAGVLLCLSFFLEAAHAIGPAYLLRGAVVTAELAWTTRFHRPPVFPELYVKFIWVSLWMVVLGLWAAGCFPRYRIGMLHFVFVGGLSLMLFAVATVVVLSHSGQSQRLRGQLWIVPVMGVMVAGAVVARLLAEFVPAAFFPLMGVASALWLVMAVSWLCFSLPPVSHPVPVDEVQRLQQDAGRQS